MTRTRNIAAHGGGGRRIDGHRRQLVGFVGGEATERTQRDGEEDEEGKEAQEDVPSSLPGWPTPMIRAEIDIFFRPRRPKTQVVAQVASPTSDHYYSKTSSVTRVSGICKHGMR